MEAESEYLYEKRIKELQSQIKQMQAILKAILDGRTVHKKELERMLKDDF